VAASTHRRGHRRATDARWPRRAGRAAELQVRAGSFIGLYRPQHLAASLNVLSHPADGVGSGTRETAVVCAAHAAADPASVQHRNDLYEALANRELIGKAVGILASRYRIDTDHASSLLRRTSPEHNIKLRQLSQRIVKDQNKHPMANDPLLEQPPE
jgi:hypothetical protein